MAKSILWREGGVTRENEEKQLKEAKEKLIKIFVRAFEIIENNSQDYKLIFPHMNKLRSVVANSDALSLLTEVYYFQNLHSLAEELLDKIGYQKTNLIQELYLALVQSSKLI